MRYSIEGGNLPALIMTLEPGETKKVSFTLDKRAFAYYDAEVKDWQVSTGDYTLAAGLSSAELTAKTTIHIEGRNFIPEEITPDTLFGDILRIDGAMDIIKPYLKAFGLDAGTSDDGAMGGGTAEMIDSMIRYMPVRNLLPFGGGDVNCGDCKTLIDKLQNLIGK